MTKPLHAPDNGVADETEPVIDIDDILNQSLGISHPDPELEEAVSALEAEWLAEQQVEDQWAADDAHIESIIPDDQLPDFLHYQTTRDAGEFRGSYGDWQNFKAPRQGPKEPSWADRLKEDHAVAATKAAER